jgi:uncharacterized membrane protein
MEHLLEQLEHSLAGFISVLTVVLEAIAAVMVFWGLVRTVQVALKMRSRKHRGRHPILEQPLDFIQIRLTFGMWLALALEFQLGADILNTTISPSFEALGRLGAIALIRTFLNYFLNKELEVEQKRLTGEGSAVD